jgi:hypothetical protein
MNIGSIANCKKMVQQAAAYADDVPSLQYWRLRFLYTFADLKWKSWLARNAFPLFSRLHVINITKMGFETINID